MDIASIVIIVLTVFGIIITSIFKPNIVINNHTFSLYWMVALLGAIILLAGTFLPINEFYDGLISSSGMNPLKILVLFLSMTCISLFLDELGFFSFLASYVIKKTKSSQMKVFISFYILVSSLTIFTSNDIIILTLTPFIISFCKRGKISPIPYLVGEFLAANTWSMIFIIGNPTNIYIASNYNINFVDYLKVMALPTLLAGVLEFILLALIFYKKLSTPLGYDELDTKKLNKPLVIFGLVILLICTVMLIVSSYVSVLEMWYIALGSFVVLVIGALIYALRKKQKPVELVGAIKKAPYELIPFLLSMFVVALTLTHYGFTTKIHEFFGSSYANIVYGYTSLLSANLVNNIPMSVTYTNIISGLKGSSLSLAIYSSIIGSNIGAFITPLGALAGIMWMNILKKNEIKYSFLSFIKYGLLIGLPVATVAIFALQIVVK